MTPVTQTASAAALPADACPIVKEARAGSSSAQTKVLTQLAGDDGVVGDGRELRAKSGVQDGKKMALPSSPSEGIQRASESRNQESGIRNQDAGGWMQDAGCRMLDAD